MRDLSSSPFHTAASEYLRAGFRPFPLPLGKRFPPPKGVPNELDLDISNFKSLVHQWSKSSGMSNIGTVVPDDCVVFDVDGPAAKQAMRDLQREHGKLPATWCVSRGNPDRFHMWYRTKGGLTWPGKLLDGIDVLYRHYRYALLPPSIHPSKSRYEWVRFSNKRLVTIEGTFPTIDDLAELPQEWHALARDTPYQNRERQKEIDVQLWAREHGTGDPCHVMTRVLKLHKRRISSAGSAGGAHDSMVNAVWATVAEIANGHSGGTQTLKAIRDHFIEVITESGRRDETTARLEWQRACVGAIEKITTQTVHLGDPCAADSLDSETDNEDFFGKGGFLAAEFRGALEETQSFAVGNGATIYRHYEGIWVPDGGKKSIVEPPSC